MGVYVWVGELRVPVVRGWMPEGRVWATRGRGEGEGRTAGIGDEEQCCMYWFAVRYS